MNNTTDQDAFDENMQSFMKILEENGCVMESDHVYAYSMQYPLMKDKVIDWLYSHGYNGKARVIGAYKEVAVYCLYDEDKMSYEEAYDRLLQEADRQNTFFL